MAYGATAVADWDSTKPVGASEAVNILDDALREVKVCVENDIKTSAEITALSVAAVAAAVPGLNVRPKFTWKDTDEIYVDPFCIYHKGTSEQLLYCDTQLTFQFANLGASDWSYLYLDDSAIVSAGTALISASELVDAVTEPAYDVTDHSWMSGHDKAIFGVRTNGSSQILEFWQSGDIVFHADSIVNQAAVDIDTTWTDIGALVIPKFATLGIVYFRGYQTATWYWRKNGASGTSGHLIGSRESSTGWVEASNQQVITDGSQVIEVKATASDADTIACNTMGWKFPVGM